MDNSIRIGISACLLGRPVRYDGQHKLDRYLADTLGRYKGLVPLLAPLTLLQHYVRKYRVEYLQNQCYLTPHPLELKLRNHP